MSNIFESSLNSIKRNQILKKSGKDISIPFGFERLDKVHPGITRGTYTLISSLQKTGKTNLANYIYVINLINFLYNTKTNIKAKVFYFSLEMTGQQLLHQLMCHRLYIKHNIRIDVKHLNSLFNGEAVSDEIIKFIEEDKAWFDKLNETVEIIENIKNPFGIYKKVRSFYDDPLIGSFSKKDYDYIDDDGKRHNGQANDKYTHIDEDLFVFVIIDNYNNLTPEKGGKIYDAIGKWSGDYAISLRNTFSANIVGIQQQTAETNNNDAYKLGKLEPCIENLKDYKATGNDIDCFITLYSPFRNKLSKYDGYDITRLKDHYRRFSIPLDRNGISIDTDLYFDGCVNLFKQMPLVEDKDNLTKVYNLIDSFK